jgi:hypothetical protein
MGFSRRRFLLTALSASLAAPAGAAPHPIWPGASFSRADRDHAIRRGLNFIYRLSKKPRNFGEYGDDFLWCFYTLSSTAADPWLKANAWRMGQERARQWRRINPRVPKDADADAIASLVFGSLAADCLEIRDDAMKPALAEAAKRFTAVDFLRLDPAKGTIPDDIRGECKDANARAAPNSGDCSTPAQDPQPVRGPAGCARHHL